ncbi:hypothetical protein GCM10022393_42010 [Aquimarina addita]|uniref:HNH endonuclease n=1 Tax=Aquimarina addita TaxID=870485 RepID=A0ABP6UUN4_9FLAO
MQDYIDLAEKNGVILLDKGKCQFCGANTPRGIHECLEIFNFEIQHIDFSNIDNHIYRFLIVDSHTLQHPEIHGRWNNHFHLTRLHLIFKYDTNWTYQHSPKHSEYLNDYKSDRQNEYLILPKVFKRGNITTADINEKSKDKTVCKDLIRKWALDVYDT